MAPHPLPPLESSSFLIALGSGVERSNSAYEIHTLRWPLGEISRSYNERAQNLSVTLFTDLEVDVCFPHNF
jgi:hypothetical protein